MDEFFGKCIPARPTPSQCLPKAQDFSKCSPPARVFNRNTSRYELQCTDTNKFMCLLGQKTVEKKSGENCTITTSYWYCRYREKTSMEFNPINDSILAANMKINSKVTCKKDGDPLCYGNRATCLSLNPLCKWDPNQDNTEKQNKGVCVPNNAWKNPNLGTNTARCAPPQRQTGRTYISCWPTLATPSCTLTRGKDVFTSEYLNYDGKICKRLSSTTYCKGRNANEDSDFVIDSGYVGLSCE